MPKTMQSPVLFEAVAHGGATLVVAQPLVVSSSGTAAQPHKLQQQQQQHHVVDYCHEIENVVPQNGELLPAKKLPKLLSVKLPNGIPTVSAMSTLNATGSKRKSYGHSPGKKKQMHQNAINSLKSWNLKIVPSGLDKVIERTATAVRPDMATGKEPATGNGGNVPAGKVKQPLPSDSGGGTTTATGVRKKCTDDSTGDGERPTDSFSNANGHSEKYGTPSVSGSVGGGGDGFHPSLTHYHHHPSTHHSSSLTSNVSTQTAVAITSAAVSTSATVPVAPPSYTNVSSSPGSSSPSIVVSQQSLPAKGYSKGHGGVKATAVHVSTSSTSPPCIVYSSASNLMAAMASNGGSSSDGSTVPPHTYDTVRALLQGVKQHHSQQLVHLNQHQHSQPQQQCLPATPTKYSKQLLHDIRMQMTLTANGASNAVTSSIFRNSHHQLNFNQQLQHHMLSQQQQQQHQQQQHQQQQQQQQQQQHQHQHHHQHLHHPHQPQYFQHHQQHLQRTYGGGIYSCDELIHPATVTGESWYASFGINELLIAGANGNGGSVTTTTVSNGAADSGIVFGHQHHGQYSVHHQQTLPAVQSYHQNNNYQYQNRNLNRGNHSGSLANGVGHGGGTVMGKKHWNGGYQHVVGGGKKGNGYTSNGSKFGAKTHNLINGCRRNYSNQLGAGFRSEQQLQQQHHQQQHTHRNLVYVRNYDRGHGALPGNDDSRSPSPRPKSESPPSTLLGSGEPLATKAAEEKRDVEEKPLESNAVAELINSFKKCSASIPGSSNSSSMASIVSSDSSTSQQLPLNADNLSCNGTGYESDSSHSSSYNSRSHRYCKHTGGGGQTYRSSSSTSSGVSSSTTYPPLSSADGSAGNGSSPVESPIGTPRLVCGSQSLPLFSDLFVPSTDQQYYSHHHQQKPTFAFGYDTTTSTSAVELALQQHAATASSTNSATSASTVPPNELHSLQSGHPKKRNPTGRTSPIDHSYGQPNKAGRAQQVATSSNHSAQLQVNGRKTGVAHIQGKMLSGDESSYQTPPDRFLSRAHLVELKCAPDALFTGSQWDTLSKAVWEKFAAAQQTERTYVQKMQLWRYLYVIIKKSYPKFGLYLVGSTISGFGADSSDVDMCLVSRNNPAFYDHRVEAVHYLQQIKQYLMNLGSTFEQFSLIQAKVPILRFRDSMCDGVEVDLNYNNCVGIRNTHLLHCYSQMDWRLRPLALVVKLWAQHHNINDAKNMTISSYSLVLMVIHFLQCGVSPPILPCLHAMYPDKFMKIVDINLIDMNEQIEPYHSDNRQTLGELLVQFLEYYANFDYSQHAISIRTASVLPIDVCRQARSYKNDPFHWKLLCIEEPFDLTNTARSVFDADIFEQIKAIFDTSWRAVKRSNDLESLFDEPLFTPVASTLSITS